MDEIVIFGAGGFGREVAWIIEDINRVGKRFELLGFVDDDPQMKGRILNGYPVLGGIEYLERKRSLGIALGLGLPVARHKVMRRLEHLDLKYPNLIHPSAYIGPGVEFGIGNIVYIGCVLAPNCKLGNFCVLELKATVGHDAVLDDFASTAVGVDFGGYSHAAYGTYFGNHATVLPSIKIGAWTVVGAGAVVNRDLPENVVAVGVPARVIKP